MSSRPAAHSDLGASDSDLGASDSDLGASDSDLGASGSDLGASDSDLGASDSDLGASDSELGASDSDTFTPNWARSTSGRSLEQAKLPSLTAPMLRDKWRFGEFTNCFMFYMYTSIGGWN